MYINIFQCIFSWIVDINGKKNLRKHKNNLIYSFQCFTFVHVWVLQRKWFQVNTTSILTKQMRRNFLQNSFFKFTAQFLEGNSWNWQTCTTSLSIPETGGQYECPWLKINILKNLKWQVTGILKGNYHDKNVHKY